MAATPRQRKVQEALDLFAQLQSAPFVIDDDEHRVRHAATLHRNEATSSAPATSSSSGPANMLRKGTGAGGGAAPSLQTTRQLQKQIADLNKRIAISDTLMRKLHRKNRDLQSELDELKGGKKSEKGDDANVGGQPQTAVGGGKKSVTPLSLVATSATSSSVLSNEQLQSIIVKRDQEIMALRRQVQNLARQGGSEKSAEGGTNTNKTNSGPANEEDNTTLSGGAATPGPSVSTPARPNTNTSKSGPSSGIAPSSRSGTTITLPTGVPLEAHLAFLHKRIDTLQSDYQALLDTKLDAIAQGESTGKVNKQVKSFFAAVKGKIATDAADYEAERVLWHQRLAFITSNYGGAESKM